MPPDFCHHHHHVGIDGFIVYENHCNGNVDAMAQTDDDDDDNDDDGGGGDDDIDGKDDGRGDDN